MWLGQVPWAGRYWALPFLTVLAPSARYYRQRGRRHKKLTDWARQMVLQLRRWLPQRSLVLVGDGGYAVLDLLHCCQSLAQPVTLIARLRLDAALYEPAPPRQPGRNGRPPLKGRRLPALKALLDLPAVSWVEVSAAWYDGTTRTVELTSQTAVWYRSGKPPVPLRWVLVRDPQGEFATQALLCTDLAVDAVHGIYDRAKAFTHPQAKRRRTAQLALERQLLALGQPFRHDPSATQAKLCRRIERHIKSLPRTGYGEPFVFVAEPAVPSDNNAAERSLRHLVISRKISGSTRSEQGTESKMTLASLFGTWRAQGLNPLAACRQLLVSPLL